MCTQARIPRLTAHELRHTAITLARLAGADREQLRRQVGHGGQDITALYDHSHLDELERRKLAMPLEVLLQNRFPYDSVTAPENDQKYPKVTSAADSQSMPKSLVFDSVDTQAEVK